MSHVWLAGLLSVMSVQVDVKPLAGSAVQGELIRIDDDALILKTDSGEESLAFTNLRSLSQTAVKKAPGTAGSTEVRLVDDSLLLAERFSADDGQANVVLAGGETVSVPTRSIRYVLQQDLSTEEVLVEQWKAILDERRPGDTVVIRVKSALDHLTGVLGDVAGETVSFEFDGDEIDVKRSKLAGWIYFHPINRDLPDRICRLLDVNGSIWNVKSMEFADNRLDFVSAAGVKHSMEMNRIFELDFSSGNTAYLSDLEPEMVSWRPFFGSRLPQEMLDKMFRPSNDKHHGGQPLVLDGQTYMKGLSLRSRTELSYRFTDEYRAFHAVAGIDDSMGDGGEVELVIHGDDRELYRESIKGGDPPQTINLKLQGVRRLRILVDYGPEADIADQLNLCDARITK